MLDLPKPKEPEWKSWPLEKLQSEYFALKMRHITLELGNIEDKHKLEKVDNLIHALKELLQEDKLPF